MRRLFLLQLAGNALLLWLAYAWLSVDESSGLKLVFSTVDALLILALACWLHGANMVYGSAQGETINAAFRTALRNLWVLVLLAVAVLAIYGLVGKWETASDQPAFQLASWLTLKFRKPVKPATVRWIFHAVFWVVRWAVLPVLLLPLAVGLAQHGWRGWRAIAMRRTWFWLRVPFLAVLGLWLPCVLLGWRPHVGGFGFEMVSFALRAIVAYLLFVGGVMGIEGFVSHSTYVARKPSS
jgi:hypothetical protein